MGNNRNTKAIKLNVLKTTSGMSNNAGINSDTDRNDRNKVLSTMDMAGQHKNTISGESKVVCRVVNEADLATNRMVSEVSPELENPSCGKHV